MVNLRDIQEKLLEIIDLMIEERFKTLSKFNYYIEAVVKTNNPDGTCNIEHNEQVLNNVKKRTGLTLAINDVVLVCVVNGNFSNKFIDLKRP